MWPENPWGADMSLNEKEKWSVSFEWKGRVGMVVVCGL
jgi:hypothetical protein